MKKTRKIIISLGVALLIAATVLVVSLVKSREAAKENTTAPVYSLQSTRAPSTTGVTESWVDLEQMASELATATETETTETTETTVVTDTTLPSDTTITETQKPTEPVVYTTIVYVIYSETNAPQTTQAETKAPEEEPEMVEYKYTVDKASGGVVVNKYLGDDPVVWVPEKISGYTVTGIGSKCFEKHSLKGVVIPETVTSIGNNAFQGCKNLASVTFKGAPSTITVGNNAFQECSKLKSINLPAAKKIGNLAFDSCTSLEKMYLEFGTEEIGDYCFRNCTNLKEVEIPESVNVIGQGAFSGEHRDDMVIYCVEGTPGHDAALKYGIKFELVS